MNITHFVENLNRGGLERMVIELVKTQQSQGHHCQVVCFFDAGSLAHELADSSIPVHACGKRLGFDWRALGRARRWVADHATDVLHTHNAVAHYQATLATAGLSIRCVINTRHGMGEGPRSRRRDWLYQRALARTDAVVTVCEAARRIAVESRSVPETKARTIPNGIRLEAFKEWSDITRLSLRRACGVPETTRLIGSIGRLNWAKDQGTLIRAFGRVHASLPDTALLLVGDGELRGELQAIAAAEGLASNVHFLGDRNDVKELLRGLDMFVLSSLSEGYSMALLEACAVGLPIVATDVGGNCEIVHDGISGLLAPAGGVHFLAETMMAVLQNPLRARTLGDAARSWVQANGSLQTMVGRYDTLYRQAMD